MSAGVPAVVIIAHFLVSRDKVDLEQGLLGMYSCCIAAQKSFKLISWAGGEGGCKVSGS